jgi:hypothetical protein
VSPNARIVPACKPGADLAVQLLALSLVHGDVPGESAQERDVLVGRVLRLPEIAPNVDVLEQSGGRDLR